MKYLYEYSSFNLENIFNTEIIPLIEQNCKPFLDYIVKEKIYKPLTRGVSNKNVLNVGLFKSRKNRRPLSTNIKLHSEIDNQFYKKFGVKPRSEGIFVNFDDREFSLYGKKYIFIPLNDFKYIWSPAVDDLYKFEDNLTKRNSKYYIEMEDFISDYKMDDLKEASDKNPKNEISFICDEYCLIDFKYKDLYINYVNKLINN